MNNEREGVRQIGRWREIEKEDRRSVRREMKE